MNPATTAMRVDLPCVLTCGHAARELELPLQACCHQVRQLLRDHLQGEVDPQVRVVLAEARKQGGLQARGSGGGGDGKRESPFCAPHGKGSVRDVVLLQVGSCVKKKPQRGQEAQARLSAAPLLSPCVAPSAQAWARVGPGSPCPVTE